MVSFSQKVSIPGFFVLFSLFSCGGKAISGEIIHEKGAPYTYQGNFKFSPESHATVTLIRLEGEDSPGKVIASQKIEDIDSFPIPFHLKWSEDLDFSGRYTYRLRAKVFSQGGEEMREGDLLTEGATEWEPEQGFVTLKATAVELCSRQGIGGFCLGE